MSLEHVSTDELVPEVAHQQTAQLVLVTWCDGMMMMMMMMMVIIMILVINYDDEPHLEVQQGDDVLGAVVHVAHETLLDEVHLIVHLVPGPDVDLVVEGELLLVSVDPVMTLLMMTLVTVTPHLKMPRTGFHCMTWLSLAVPELSTTCGSNLRRDRGIVSLLTTSYHPSSMS